MSADEYSYLLDLHLFLGRPLLILPTTGSTKNMESAVGKMPQTMIEEELTELINWHNSSTDLVGLPRILGAHKLYSIISFIFFETIVK